MRDGAEPGAVKHSKAYIGAAHIGQQNGVRLVHPQSLPPPNLYRVDRRSGPIKKLAGMKMSTALGAAGPLGVSGFAQNRRPVRGYNMAAPEGGVEICQPVALRGVYRWHPDTAARLAVVLQ